MIARLTASHLRSLADQLDAYGTLNRAGAPFPSPNTVLSIDDTPLAYLAWWEDRQQFLAEFISFTPGDAVPLVWHDPADASA